MSVVLRARCLFISMLVKELREFLKDKDGSLEIDLIVHSYELVLRRVEEVPTDITPVESAAPAKE